MVACRLGNLLLQQTQFKVEVKMCLAIPGLVEEIFQEQEMLSATVNFNGVKRRVCLSFTPQAKIGEYVLVHVGFALSIVDEKEAKATLEALSLMKDTEVST